MYFSVQFSILYHFLNAFSLIASSAFSFIPTIHDLLYLPLCSFLALSSFHYFFMYTSNHQLLFEHQFLTSILSRFILNLLSNLSFIVFIFYLMRTSFHCKVLCQDLACTNIIFASLSCIIKTYNKIKHKRASLLAYSPNLLSVLLWFITVV